MFFSAKTCLFKDYAWQPAKDGPTTVAEVLVFLFKSSNDRNSYLIASAFGIGIALIKYS